MSQATALVPAAGFGTRFHEGGPKALVLLAGKPLLVHALERLAASKRVSSAVVALTSAATGASFTGVTVMLTRPVAYKLPSNTVNVKLSGPT